MTNWKELRQAVFARCKGYCEFCALPISENDFALHHRKLKSRGGKDSINNLVAVHHHCHNLGTDSIHLNPAEAERRGFMVPSWKNPIECPLVMGNGLTVILLDDGSYKVLEGNNNGW